MQKKKHSTEIGWHEKGFQFHHKDNGKLIILKNTCGNNEFLTGIE